MDVVNLPIDPVKRLRPRRVADARGSFTETWNRRALEREGIAVDFVQDNQSFSHAAGTIRGLHFQRPPFAQAKLVRVIRGAIFDVAVDLRRGSSTFGRHVCAVLDATGGDQLYIPVGFAHGFCTLEPDTEVAYKVSEFHDPASEAGIVWNDPDIAIAWPDVAAEPILSDRDARLPRLADIDPGLW